MNNSQAKTSYSHADFSVNKLIAKQMRSQTDFMTSTYSKNTSKAKSPIK